MFKESNTHIHASIKCEADTGYQGLKKIHNHTELPKKKTKKNPLTKEDKKQNHKISSSRVMVENVIRDVKIFRIVAEKYRNRGKKFGLKFNLIAIFYNLNLNFK